MTRPPLLGAKALDTTPEPDPSQSPTLTAAATQVGVILGTAAYMSPEQARGKPVDRRADIWAFGAVLYEMLSGQHAFQGDDVSSTLAKVLEKEPVWESLPANTPPRIHNIVRRCLEKEPKDRVQAAGDVRLAMYGAFDTTISPPSVSVVAPQLQGWQRELPAATIALVIGATVGVGVWTLTRPNLISPGLVRFSIVPPDRLPLGTASEAHDLAISQDGTKIIYQGPVAPVGEQQLILRAIDRLEGVPVRGTDGGIGPFFSPDGAWVGFTDVVGRTLQKVSVFGGPPLTLCSSEERILGATWRTDETIIFGTRGAGLFKVAADGGQPEALTTLGDGEAGHYWPSMIAGTEVVVFVTGTAAPLTTGELALLEMDTGEVTRLGLAGIGPHYVSTGHLVFGARDGSIRAIPFDPGRREITGSPVPLVEGVLMKSSGAADFSISDSGHLAYAGGIGGSAGRRSLVWVDRTGQEEQAGVPPRAYTYPRISPDGLRVSLDINDQEDDAWIWDPARGTMTRLTLTGEAEAYGEWSPNGDRVVFVSEREGPYNLFWKAADGTGAVQRLATPSRGGRVTAVGLPLAVSAVSSCVPV